MKKMKRFLGITIVIMLLLSTLTIQSFAAGDSDFTVSNGVLTGYTGAGGAVTIPSDMGITAIGEGAFYNNWNMTSVTIPNSVTSIGNNAFGNCSILSSITIPNGVKSIGNDAFSNCTKITLITIPDSVTTIGDFAFSKCGLTSITIPNSVTSIGEGAFSSCYSLTSLTIPNSVTSIGDSAFEGCTKITSIKIPNSVTSIGDCAFAFCSNLTSITIPDSVTSICNSAFVNCNSLTSITIPNSVTSIGIEAFKGCTNIKIYGGTGSYAQQYASQNNIPFTAEPLPTTPTSLTSTNKTYISADLSWTAVTGAIGYDIYNGSTKVNSEPILSSSYTVTGLLQTTQYSFTVRAVNDIGESASSNAISVTTNSAVKGDINGDGNITSADALIVLKASAGKITLSDSEIQAADVNISGKVTSADALEILKYASGKIKSFS